MTTSPAARILIVDDEPSLTKSLCDTLGDAGYETVGCHSAEAALKALETNPFDLVLTDLMMPGMDGIALCQAMQKSDPSLVSVLMTGGGSTASAVSAMQAGAIDYVTKPLELSVILAVLSRSLDVRRLRLENARLARHVAERTAELEAANQALRMSEKQLRTLANWAVQAQEDERAGLALRLHDNITQLLCAIQIRTHLLADKLPISDDPGKSEATKLRDMLGNAAEEVENISRNLRPGVLKELGLVAVLQDTIRKFGESPGMSVKLTCVELPSRLPANTELGLYRILQESLENVRKHARARHVTVQLAKQDDLLRLTITDDGIGFNPETLSARRKIEGDLGLLGMRERAASLGGALTIKSVPRAGTEIEVRVPLPPRGRSA